jgi:transposase
MPAIPTSVSAETFKRHIEPHLSKAKRGYACKVSLEKIFNAILDKLYSGCQWRMLKLDEDIANLLTWQAIYWHHRKWSRDGSLEKVWKNSLIELGKKEDFSELQLDGSHTIAKRGGESVGYQNRKKAKTTNVLFLCTKTGYPIGISEPVSGNHHDSFELIGQMKKLFKNIKSLINTQETVYLNADSGFDNKGLRKFLFNNGITPNIKENPRNRKKTKRGRKKLFNEAVYKNRFVIERTFAWLDKFRTLAVRYERKAVFWLGFHFIAFTLINLKV